MNLLRGLVTADTIMLLWVLRNQANIKSVQQWHERENMRKLDMIVMVHLPALRDYILGRRR